MDKKNQSIDNISSALTWQLLQRFGASLIQFLITTLLARLLLPEDYGIISLVSVFISVSTLLIDAGLGTAIIQQATLSDDECSSVFWLQLLLGIVICLLLFLFAPFISKYYNNPIITHVLQVYSFVLIPNVVSGILSSRLIRQMKFKSIMLCNIFPMIISGVIGISLALFGFGIYSLVVQSLLNSILYAMFLFIACKWCPHFVFLPDNVYIMLKFSIKLLLANIIEMAYKNLYSLAIPKIYGNQVLGYYTYGRQIPNVLVSTINGATNSVMFSFLSKIQDNTPMVCDNVRKAMRMSNFIIFPTMLGIAALSKPIVYILLGEIWLPVSPYLFLFCITHALFHLQFINFQAMAAIGRSDMFLKYEIIKKCIGVVILITTISMGVIPMMLGQLILAIVYILLGIYPNIKLLGYSLANQVSDFIPYAILSSIMFFAVKASIYFLPPNALLLQATIGVLVGVVVYWILCVLTKNSTYFILLHSLKKQMGSSNEIG